LLDAAVTAATAFAAITFARPVEQNLIASAAVAAIDTSGCAFPATIAAAAFAVIIALASPVGRATQSSPFANMTRMLLVVGAAAAATESPSGIAPSGIAIAAATASETVAFIEIGAAAAIAIATGETEDTTAAAAAAAIAPALRSWSRAIVV